MGSAQIPPLHWLRVVGLLVSLIIAAGAWDQAQARSLRKDPPKRAIHGPNYRPPYAAIVVDDNSGSVLHEVSADEPRHPASLTKIMTLYLLFEQLENGALRLDTPLPISSRAALQPPTKLGLKADQTIKVEDAINGLVTQSANDAAVVVAEAVGGSEEEFAKLMTLKARGLGMTSTTYVNASGLPAEEQITTARDQAVLGRAIQDRFPGYYRYFSTPSFRYKGVEMHNHNALLGQVKGIDGIKTGYTEASGYNLVASVHREGKHIVAVVLGGTSNAARNARMCQLIEDHIPLAWTRLTVPSISKANGRVDEEGAHGPVAAAAAGNAAAPAGERAYTALARARAALVPIRKPPARSAKRSASPVEQVASTKTLTNRMHGPTAIANDAVTVTSKVSTLRALQSPSSSAVRQNP
jgi:D-alanyl-D-alanine carboxypeptidase